VTEPLVLTFHAPTVPLSINRAHQLHWAARRRLTDPWRDMATVLMRQVIRGRWVNVRPVTIQVDLPFRTRGRRDPHNYVGTVVKAVVDGLVTGGLIPDDTPEWATILEPTISHQPDKSEQLVATITITPRSPHHGD
jgi:hypothetical protein